MTRFQVTVPFESVVHESLDSRVFTQLPDAEFTGGLRLSGIDGGYVGEMELEANHPAAAKASGIRVVERVLAVLASWNYAFQIRIGGVRSERIDTPGAVTVVASDSGPTQVLASDTIFVEEHAEVVVQKANLDLENEFYGRYDELPEFVRSCLELNYLLVLSTRPPNRWLLAATGLESLAVGASGPQETVSGQLSASSRGILKQQVRAAVTRAELDELEDRVWQRILSTTTSGLADHVHRYLLTVGVDDVTPDDFGRWWRTRGRVAHGATADIDQGDLNRLIAVFQTALRRTAGAEAVPA